MDLIESLNKQIDTRVRERRRLTLEIRDLEEELEEELKRKSVK